jgi:hypothetical protein
MRVITLLAVSIMIVGIGAVAYAQGRVGGNYNPATETTLIGTVDSVKNLPSPGRGGGGLHLMLAVATGPIEVHVGPASFVSSRNVTFAKGDTLTIVGSKMRPAESAVSPIAAPQPFTRSRSLRSSTPMYLAFL